LISDINSISASGIQGSALGLETVIVTASDLTTTVPENTMKKYADAYCYLVITASNSYSIPSELLHVVEWALENNLRLNASKTSGIVFYRPNSRNRRIYTPSHTGRPGHTRVTTMKVLGILLTDNLKMTIIAAHDSATISTCTRSI